MFYPPVKAATFSKHEFRGEKLNYKTRWAPEKTVPMDDF